MSAVQLLRTLHELTLLFFGGGLLALLYAQSRVARVKETAEKRGVADTVSGAARAVVVPLMFAGFVAGLVLMVMLYGGYGMGKLMSCTPVYVHIMMTFGILALGFSQVWKAKVRKLAKALADGTDSAPHRRGATLFAWLALAATLVAFAVAESRTPNPPRDRCVPPQAAVPARDASFLG